MTPYYSRPDLLPGIHHAINQKSGQTLREIARQNSCHVETIKATIKDEFRVYKTKTSHYVFPLNFTQNPELFLLMQNDWWQEIHSLQPRSAQDLGYQTGWPRSTCSHRLKKYRESMENPQSNN